MKYWSLTLYLALLAASGSLAGGSTWIDASTGNMANAIAQYEAAIKGRPNSASQRIRINLIIDAKKGFPAGVVRLPNRRRRQEIEIVVHMRGAGPLRDDLILNAIELNARGIQRLSQNLEIRR